jgi:hypothetical protein
MVSKLHFAADDVQAEVINAITQLQGQGRVRAVRTRRHRVINLQKLFPHIPDQLNHVLLHFSRGAEVFYERTEELLEDLRSCEAMLPS